MSRPGRLCLFLAITAATSLGCGGAPSGEYGPKASSGMLKDAGGMDDRVAQAPAAQPPAGKADPAAPPAARADRKIIYTARLDLVVKNLDEATRGVEEQSAAHGGRLARSEVRSDAGARRTATFTLEVPVEKFRGLVDGLKRLGVPERDTLDSQDVTEEFVDVQARVKNLKEQETKLNELLKERRKEEKLEDVIRVGDRIGEVRQQIERVEGRLKYLEAKAAFSTVTLSVREQADYQPPSAPTFGDRVGRAFSGSWDALVAFGEGVVLFAAAVSVWLPPMALAGVILGWGLRRLVRRARAG